MKATAMLAPSMSLTEFVIKKFRTGLAVDVMVNGKKMRGRIVLMEMGPRPTAIYAKVIIRENEDEDKVVWSRIDPRGRVYVLGPDEGPRYD